MVYFNGELEPAILMNMLCSLAGIGTSRKNEFLFHCSRGKLRATLILSNVISLLIPEIPPLPDLRPGDPGPTLRYGVITHPPFPQKDLIWWFSQPDRAQAVFEVPRIPPLSTRKVAFNLMPRMREMKRKETSKLRLSAGKGCLSSDWDSARLSLRFRKSNETYKRTFYQWISTGALQYYARSTRRFQMLALRASRGE